MLDHWRENGFFERWRRPFRVVTRVWRFLLMSDWSFSENLVPRGVFNFWCYRNWGLVFFAYKCAVSYFLERYLIKMYCRRSLTTSTWILSTNLKCGLLSYGWISLNCESTRGRWSITRSSLWYIRCLHSSTLLK